MEKKLFIAFTVAVFWLLNPVPFADAQTNQPVIADLNRLIVQINTKLNAGKRKEADFADDLKQFDVLLAEHKGENAASLAEVPRMKADFYLQVLNQPDKALELFKQIKRDFPEVQINGNTDATISAVERMAALGKIRNALAEGSAFPDFDEKDIAGKPLSVANYKGKVVLIDFWATWCPPCRMELPNILAAYKKYHDAGFEVIGINLDQDRQQLDEFLKAQNLPWPQYNDGKFWDTKLVVKYGVSQLPTTWLLDRRGIIIDRDLRGEDLTAAVAKALANK
jgi:thiol-disulfide isomerase/thioredoxin